MKNSSPVSLFSFQDIITCLTGIMIVVVLVLLLQLVEAISGATARAAHLPEYQELMKKKNALLAIRDQLRSRSQTAAAPAVKIELSAAELRSLIRDERAKQIRQTLAIQTQRQSTARLLAETSQLQEQITAAENALQQLSVPENELRNLRESLKQLQQAQAQVKQKIEKRKKQLAFEFSGENSRIPILIECCGWGFRARVYPRGKVMRFGDPKKTNADSQIPALMNWLTSLNSPANYPVLLCREESLPYLSDLRLQLQLRSIGSNIGIEPLAPQEECFPDE